MPGQSLEDGCCLVQHCLKVEVCILVNDKVRLSTVCDPASSPHKLNTEVSRYSLLGSQMLRKATHLCVDHTCLSILKVLAKLNLLLLGNECSLCITNI